MTSLCGCTSLTLSRSSVTEHMRMSELELTTQSLRDTLREKEKELDGTVKEMRKQQADRHRWQHQKYDQC